MFDSIHSGRWLEQFRDEDIDFYIFPSRKYKHLNSILYELASSKNCAKYEFPTLRITKKFSGYMDYLFFVAIKKYFKIDVRRIMLSQIINHTNLDFIHALEIQGAGYLCSDAIGMGTKADFIVTNWGSDIYYFSKFEDHLVKIKNVLALATMYSGECHRDYLLAKSLGFKKHELPCIPNAGGFDIESFSTVEKLPSKRTTIIVKGYGGMFGRADIIMNLLPRIIDQNPRYKFFFYSVTNDLLKNLIELRKNYPKNISFSTVHKPISRQKLLETFSESRVYIGASISDGVSTSFLEALITGAYPIQTDTSCANEWIKKGFRASVVPLKSEELEIVISRTLKDDSLVDDACKINRNLATLYLDKNAIFEKARLFYEKNI